MWTLLRQGQPDGLWVPRGGGQALAGEQRGGFWSCCQFSNLKFRWPQVRRTGKGWSQAPADGRQSLSQHGDRQGEAAEGKALEVIPAARALLWVCHREALGSSDVLASFLSLGKGRLALGQPVSVPGPYESRDNPAGLALSLSCAAGETLIFKEGKPPLGDRASTQTCAWAFLTCFLAVSGAVRSEGWGAHRGGSLCRPTEPPVLGGCVEVGRGGHGNAQ